MTGPNVAMMNTCIILLPFFHIYNARYGSSDYSTLVYRRKHLEATTPQMAGTKETCTKKVVSNTKSILGNPSKKSSKKKCTQFSFAPLLGRGRKQQWASAMWDQIKRAREVRKKYQHIEDMRRRGGWGFVLQKPVKCNPSRGAFRCRQKRRGCGSIDTNTINIVFDK